MKDTLIQLSKGIQRGPASDLVPVLFGERSPTVVKNDVSFTPFNKNLDHSQVFSLFSSSFLLIYEHITHVIFFYICEMTLSFSSLQERCY